MYTRANSSGTWQRQSDETKTFTTPLTNWSLSCDHGPINGYIDYDKEIMREQQQQKQTQQQQQQQQQHQQQQQTTAAAATTRSSPGWRGRGGDNACLCLHYKNIALYIFAEFLFLTPSACHRRQSPSAARRSVRTARTPCEAASTVE